MCKFDLFAEQPGTNLNKILYLTKMMQELNLNSYAPCDHLYGQKELTRRVSMDNLTNIVNSSNKKSNLRRMNSFDSFDKRTGEIFGSEAGVNIGRWENSFMLHIQGLIEKVCVSETMQGIENLQKENENTPVVSRNRRKRGSGNGSGRPLRLNPSYKCATRNSRPVRRSSSRTGYAGGGSYKCAIRRGLKNSFSKADNCRSKSPNPNALAKTPPVSVRRSTSFLKAVQLNPAPGCGGSPVASRRQLTYSVVSAHRSQTVSRRNSFSSSARSRSSSLSRHCSFKTTDTITSQCGCLHRNDSFTAASCFPLLSAKPADVKRRLKKLSRKRLRKERAHIDAKDIQHAVSAMNNNMGDNSSCNTLPENDTSTYCSFEDEDDLSQLDTAVYESGNRYYSINRLSRITEVSVDSNRLSRCLADFDEEILETPRDVDKADVTQKDTPTIQDNVDEEIPSEVLTNDTTVTDHTPSNTEGEGDEAVNETTRRGSDRKTSLRRRPSIQIRSWELSRKLRQRRRERRKGFIESALI